MQWQKLDKEALDKVLGQVVPSSMPPMFSAVNCEVKSAKLPFYTNFMLYRLTNNATLPSFSVDFLSDSHKFLYLDGSPTPINKVNLSGDLILNDNTVLDYVAFYVHYVADDGGEIQLIDSSKRAFPAGLMDIELSRKMLYTHRDLKIDYKSDEKLYTLELPIYYGGTLVRAVISVNSMGYLKIESSQMILRDSFEREEHSLPRE